MEKRKDKLHIWLESYTNGKEKWLWNLTSAYNGKIKCSGQASGFSSKDKALRGWEAVAKSASTGVVITVEGA